MQLHRNSQKRFYERGYIYFVVSKTSNNYPYFKERIFCDLFIEELKLCKSLKKFRLYGFCLVYDHINLLLQPSDAYNISQVIKSLKENVSRDINYVMNDIFYEGDTSMCRLQLRELLKHYRSSFFKKYNNRIPFPKFRWQKSYYDHVIRNGRDFENHWNYTSYNHVKHNMGDDWPYCTENYWEFIDDLS